MVMWPDELRIHAPSVASRLARALATPYWRARDVYPDHIASLLRRDTTVEPDPDSSDCYVSRRDFGEDLACNVDTSLSNTKPTATYASSSVLRLSRPVIAWSGSGWQQVGEEEVYTYHPAVFLHGNPRVAELVSRDIRYVDGFPFLPMAYLNYAVIVPCAYYPPDENSMVDIAWFDRTAVRVKSKTDPSKVYPLGEYANRPVKIELWDVPIGWNDIVVETELLYHYHYWLAPIENRPRWIRIWAPSEVLRRPDVAPLDTSPLNGSEGYAEIDLQVGIGVPEPLPAVPVPQTAGAVRIRALGANLYAIGHNGHWYIRAEGNLTYELALKKWGLGVEGTTSRYIEMWGTQNGVDFVKLAEYNEGDLVAGPITVTLPEGERVFFRWISSEPFPVFKAAQLVLRAVTPLP